MNYLVARDRMLQAMGSQFDTDVVVAFAAELAEADDDYRYARRPDFRPREKAQRYDPASLIAGAA